MVVGILNFCFNVVLYDFCGVLCRFTSTSSGWSLRCEECRRITLGSLCGGGCCDCLDLACRLSLV